MNTKHDMEKEKTTLQKIGEASSLNLDIIMEFNRRIKEKIIELDGGRPEKDEDVKSQSFLGYANQLLDCQNITKNRLAEMDCLLCELFRLV